MNRIRLAVALALGWAASASADDWGEVAQISTTLGVQADRLCLGEAGRGDIGCPTYAPYVSSTSGYLRLGKEVANIPFYTVLHVAPTSEYSTARVLLDSIATGNGATSNLTLRAARGSVTTPTALLADDPIGQISWMGYGSTGYGSSTRTTLKVSAPYSWTDASQPTLLTITTTPSGTISQVERFRITDGGYIGIGAPTPTTLLDVSGTIRMANGGEACDADRAGAVRWHAGAGQFQVCYGSGGWALLSSAATSGSTVDRIVSGTSSVIASQDRSVTISTAGTERIVVGENGRVGIGTTNPSASLHVYSAGTSSNMSLGASTGFYDYVSPKAFWIGGPGGAMRLVVDQTNGKVGIGTGFSPSTSLHLGGSLRIDNGGETCDADRGGAMRWHAGAGQFQVCYGSGGWALLSSAATSGSTVDRIVSGTMEMVASTKGISVTFGVTPSVYFDANSGMSVFARGVPVGNPYWTFNSNDTDIVARFMKKGNAYVHVLSQDNTGVAGLEFFGAGQRGRIYATPTYNMVISPNDQYGATNIIMANQTGANALRVGIGGLSTSTPVATLDVSGSVKIAGTGAESCTASTLGQIRLNPTSGKFEVCRH